MPISAACSRLVLALGACLFMGLASAAQLAVVAQVQAPAWLTRGTQTFPLTPGMEVKNKDRITTGAGARTYINLAEGSTVKLGSDTQFVFYSNSQKPRQNFRGALEIIKGAFRYTTNLAGKLQQRELSVRVGLSTIGVRGTDIWGRANSSEDMAVLIEGKVEMSRGDESMLMDKPLVQCRVPRDGAMLPLSMIDMDTLQDLARETEIMVGDGAMHAQGSWKVYLGDAAPQQAAALALYDQARNAGFAARIQVSKAGKVNIYRTYLPGLSDSTEAQALATRVSALIGVAVKVSR